MATATVQTTVEIITIGDELVAGYTLDRNAAYIARRLQEVGLPVRYMTSVSDSLEDMQEVFGLALRRANVVITTGGLGPTDDDLTRRAIVKFFKRNLVFHEEIWEDIRARYAKRGIDLPPVNQNQALLPQGAHLFPNKFGSAVGICINEDGQIFISLPGVPGEAEQMLVDVVIPYLQSHLKSSIIFVRTLRLTGISESQLAEKIQPTVKLEPGLKLAYLPAYSGVALRITATGENMESAGEKGRRLARRIEQSAGKYIYGYDDDSLEAVVGQLLKDNDKTLAVAESCTGGKLGMTVTTVPGSSGWFLGGIVAYSNDAKIEMLDVEPALFDEGGVGAVSESCVRQMATGCRKRFSADYTLAITGIAGPEGGTEEKEVGTVFIGLASAHASYARRFSLGTDREMVRSRAVYVSLEMLRREILDIT